MAVFVVKMFLHIDDTRSMLVKVTNRFGVLVGLDQSREILCATVTLLNNMLHHTFIVTLIYRIGLRRALINP